MKVRIGFVTNSSSSSFLIMKKYLSEKQLQAIRMHSELGERLHLQWASDSWSIHENEDFITGETYMDNFDISEFFGIIGIPVNKIMWSEFGFDLDNLNVNSEEEIEEEEENEMDWISILNELTSETDK